MRKVLLICLGLYLACGCVFGLVTDEESYMCSDHPRDAHGTVYYGAVNDIPDIPWYCMPGIGSVDRLRWVVIAAPLWLPIVVNDGESICGIHRVGFDPAVGLLVDGLPPSVAWYQHLDSFHALETPPALLH